MKRKNKIFIFGLILAFMAPFFNGCQTKIESPKPNSKLLLTYKNLYSSIWKFDSLGCLNKRWEIVNDSSFKIKDLLNSSYREVVSVFGEPNQVVIKENYFFIKYYIRCGLTPISKDQPNPTAKQSYSNTAAVLFIDFSSDSVMVDCGQEIF